MSAADQRAAERRRQAAAKQAAFIDPDTFHFFLVQSADISTPWGPARGRWCLLKHGRKIDEGYIYPPEPEQETEMNDEMITASQREMVEDDALIVWWLDDAEDMARRTIAKMIEYGSGDLVSLGQHLCRMADRPLSESDVHSMELGCLMYLLGKIERAVEAVKADRPIKDDTWFDIEVYAKMARAARSGAWKIGGA